ncbi:hypothetical protein D3C73_597480 [compost metagenome]
MADDNDLIGFIFCRNWNTTCNFYGFLQIGRTVYFKGLYLVQNQYLGPVSSRNKLKLMD